MLDFIDFDDYAIIMTVAPLEAVGVALGDSRLRSKDDGTVAGVKRAERHDLRHGRDRLRRGNLLIIAGKTAAVERVADLD